LPAAWAWSPLVISWSQPKRLSSACLKCGSAWCRRYALTGERLGAREAHRIGFVHECVPAAELDARVDKFVAQLAQGGPQALARSKKLLAKVGKAQISPKLGAVTAAAFVAARDGDEAREGIRSFLEKRKPRWSS
jgi:methylglutaconyl-CoA hydratase